MIFQHHCKGLVYRDFFHFLSEKTNRLLLEVTKKKIHLWKSGFAGIPLALIMFSAENFTIHSQFSGLYSQPISITFHFKVQKSEFW